MEDKQKKEWKETSREVAEEKKPKKCKFWKWMILGGCLLAGIVVLLLLPKRTVLPDEEFPDWGLTLSVNDVTPSGLTLVCAQAGGQFTEEFSGLITGESYYLVKAKNKKGKLVPTVIKDYGFNAIAYNIPLDADTEFNVDWEWLYGELKPGTYWLVKGFTEYRENGNHKEADYWVEFVIE